MEIRSNADALKAFLGVPSSPGASTRNVSNGSKGVDQTTLTGDQATVSRAGTEVSQTAVQDGIREERVATIQQALAAGSYSVPATKIADKVIDAMLASGLDSMK